MRRPRPRPLPWLEVGAAARNATDSTVDAPWRFVSLKHDDDGYVYYFGILHLCFTVKIGDETHECILVEYVWPDMQQYKTRADDGIPLHTRYVRTPTKLYEVLKRGCSTARRSSRRRGSARRRATHSCVSTGCSTRTCTAISEYSDE